MEEQLRFNLANFWEEASYQEGNLTNLSLHHPLNILSALMCGCSLVFNKFFPKSFKNRMLSQYIWLQAKVITFLVGVHWVLVPLGYLRIYLFLKLQNRKVSGR